MSSSSRLPRWALAGFIIASSLESVHVSPKWRLTLLRKAWFSGDLVTRRAIADDLPSWLYCFGPTALPLVREIIADALEATTTMTAVDSASEAERVLEAIASSAGMLICAQAKQQGMITR